MFNAIEIYGNNVFNLHFTKGCSCLSGNVVYLLQINGRWASAKAVQIRFRIGAERMTDSRGDKVRNGSKNRHHIRWLSDSGP